MGMISPGNSKTNLPDFSISTMSCDLIPGPDEQGCKKHCYAKRHIEIYPSAKAKYLRNFELSKSNDFVALMNKEILTNKRVQKIGLLRIHVAGDFYSQPYVDKWIEIANQHPNIIFYAYTKAYNLDFNKKPDNMLVKLSDDKNLWVGVHGAFDGVAQVVAKDYELPKPTPRNEVICANQKFGFSCAQCKMCMNPNPKVRKLTIKFRKH